jgi:nucleoid DNA-binding protein
MPKSGTLTKARIVEVVVETNGYTQKKAFETVKILLELIKRSLESGHRRGYDPGTSECRYISMLEEV